MDWTLWRPALLIVLLAAATPPASALTGLGPCIGNEIPPHVQTGGCGPGVEVQITLRYMTPDGTQEQFVVGSCEDACDLRIIIDVIACRSMSAVTGVQTVIKGQVQVLGPHGDAISYSQEQTFRAQIGLLPWCVQDETS